MLQKLWSLRLSCPVLIIVMVCLSTAQQKLFRNYREFKTTRLVLFFVFPALTISPLTSIRFTGYQLKHALHTKLPSRPIEPSTFLDLPIFLILLVSTHLQDLFVPQQTPSRLSNHQQTDPLANALSPLQRRLSGTIFLCLFAPLTLTLPFVPP